MQIVWWYGCGDILGSARQSEGSVTCARRLISPQYNGKRQVECSHRHRSSKITDDSDVSQAFEVVPASFSLFFVMLKMGKVQWPQNVFDDPGPSPGCTSFLPACLFPVILAHYQLYYPSPTSIIEYE